MAATSQIRKFAPLAIRFLIGGLFIYAGAMKAYDPRTFQGEVHGFMILPHFMEPVVALYLPWLELACGICLIARTLYAGSLLILTILMVVFTIAIAQAQMRGLDINCGCFGADTAKANYPWLLFRDTAMLAMVLYLAVTEMKTPVPAADPAIAISDEPHRA